MKTHAPRTSFSRLPLWILLIGLISLLTGCARPNDEKITEMLSEAYECKWLKVDDFEKTETLPGLWTYVARYKFKLKFTDGELGAKSFFEGLYRASNGEKEWQKVLQNPKAYAYLKEGCTGPATRVLEQMAIQSYLQLDDPARKSFQVPVAVSLNGWSEMTPNRKGWGMEIRRDKVDHNFELSQPINRKELAVWLQKKTPAPRKK